MAAMMQDRATWADFQAEDDLAIDFFAFSEEDGAEDEETELNDEDLWADAFEDPSGPVDESDDDDDEWDGDPMSGDTDLDDLPDPP